MTDRIARLKLAYGEMRRKTNWDHLSLWGGGSVAQESMLSEAIQRAGAEARFFGITSNPDEQELLGNAILIAERLGVSLSSEVNA